MCTEKNIEIGDIQDSLVQQTTASKSSQIKHQILFSTLLIMNSLILILMFGIWLGCPSTGSVTIHIKKVDRMSVFEAPQPPKCSMFFGLLERICPEGKESMPPYEFVEETQIPICVEDEDEKYPNVCRVR